MICVNCKYEHEYDYCSNCGQKAAVPKITFKSILTDAFSMITNMDRGILYNIKSLILNPGIIVNDYINGKRRPIFNPVSFLIISTTLYLLANSYIDRDNTSVEIKSSVYSIGYEAGRFIKGNFKYFWIFSIFWLGLSTKMLFGKYNYVEHLVISAFVIGLSTLLSIIGLVLFKLNLIFNPIMYIFITWMTYNIFKANRKRIDIFLLSLASTILFFINLLIVTFVIGVCKHYL